MDFVKLERSMQPSILSVWRNIQRRRGGIFVNTHACNALLHGFCKERLIKDAEAVLQYMKGRGVCPDIVTYTTLLNGYCLQGDLNRAKQVFDSLDADMKLDIGTDMKPDIVTYGALINGYCKHKRLVEAQLLFREVPFKGLDHDTCAYNMMIHGFFSNNQFSHGWKLFKDMEFRGFNPNIVTCNILLGGLCRSGEIGQALLLLHMIEREGVFHTNFIKYIVILRYLLKRSWLHESKLVLEVMYEKGFALTSGNLWMLRNQLQGVREDVSSNY